MLKNRAEGKTKLTREFGSLKCIEKGVHTVSKKKSGGGETPKLNLARLIAVFRCGIAENTRGEEISVVL